MVEIIVAPEHERTMERAMERLGVSHGWHMRDSADRLVYHFVISSANLQRVVDITQTLLDHAPDTRVTVLPVEAALPAEVADSGTPAFENGKKGRSASVTREELQQKLEEGARFGRDYLLMVLFSTVVAAIGLITDNVAVVVGAMVIAPFLGPNLALSFAITMGQPRLALEAGKSLGIGLGVVVAFSAALGLLWPDLPDTAEIASRTAFGLDAVVLALASGAAGVLDLTGAAPMTLVGVMVAVALLPPAVVLGLKLGALDWEAARGAGLLLLINIIGLNIAAKVIFSLKGISPRRWDHKEAARRATCITVALWLLLLGGIALLSLYKPGTVPVLDEILQENLAE
ncbi:MAG: TIGR00341 family protein [Alphaproteobacteria bacterium]